MTDDMARQLKCAEWLEGIAGDIRVCVSRALEFKMTAESGEGVDATGAYVTRTPTGVLNLHLRYQRKID